MHHLDIYDLQNIATVVWLYQLLEKNQTCLLEDDGIPLALITPLPSAFGVEEEPEIS